METKHDRQEKARDHYETRADRRPRQFWDEDNQRWMKEDR